LGTNGRLAARYLALMIVRSMRIRERRKQVSRPAPLERRDQAARIVELRRALRFGAFTVGLILVVLAAVLAARYPQRATPFLVFWTLGGAACGLLFVASNRARPRLITSMTVVLTIIPETLLLVGIAIEPAALLAFASMFIMLPVAVPLFMAWGRALRNGWLAAYIVVFGGATVLTGFGHLGLAERVDIVTNVVVGTVIGWLGGELLEQMRDRTHGQAVELRRLNRELQVRATTDGLTGLANRRQLETDLQIMSTSRLGGASSSAFLMLDLDQFKRLNDELGHVAGDDALRTVSAELRRVVRQRDTSYRYGGEEFLVIMPNASLDDAARAAERIRIAIAGLKIRAGRSVGTLTISCGVAFSLCAREHWEPVLAAADSALYRAKAAGRNRVVVAPAVVHEHPATRSTDRPSPQPDDPDELPASRPAELAG